ncbi:MAG: NAD+ synthase, partial [Chlamydiae bacterium]|nr:NAD+ synthase [Chlamydiota bacterium]
MVKILIAQINPILGDFEGNLKQIEKSLLSIKDFDIAVFPEMSLPGYLPSDLILDSTFIKKQNLALERLKNIVKDKLIVVGGIDSSEGEKPFFNTAFLIYEGKIQAR